MTRTPFYSPEVRACVVRMVLDHQSEHASQWAKLVKVPGESGALLHRHSRRNTSGGSHRLDRSDNPTLAQS